MKKSDSKLAATLAADGGEELFKDALIENVPTAPPPTATKAAHSFGTPIEKTARQMEVSEGDFESWALVVDDSLTSANVVAGILKSVGIGSYTFRSAPAAYKFLQDSNDSDFRKIIGVFSDIEMPEMNGLELLVKMRSDARTRDLPFVVVSGHIDKTQLPKFASLKIDGFILKPFKSQSIIDRVNHLRTAAAKAKSS